MLEVSAAGLLSSREGVESLHVVLRCLEQGLKDTVSLLNDEEDSGALAIIVRGWEKSHEL